MNRFLSLKKSALEPETVIGYEPPLLDEWHGMCRSYICTTDKHTHTFISRKKKRKEKSQKSKEEEVVGKVFVTKLSDVCNTHIPVKGSLTRRFYFIKFIKAETRQFFFTFLMNYFEYFIDIQSFIFWIFLVLQYLMILIKWWFNNSIIQLILIIIN